MAISSIPANQANGTPHVLTILKTSASNSNRNVPEASGKRNLYTVTISLRAQKIAVLAANAAKAIAIVKAASAEQAADAAKAAAAEQNSNLVLAFAESLTAAVKQNNKAALAVAVAQAANAEQNAAVS